MTSVTKIIFTCLAIFLLSPALHVNADDKVSSDDKEINIQDSEKTQWHSEMQSKYELTDDQMKTLTDTGLSYPQLVKIAQLSKSSDKTLEEVIAMRVDQKMGWGKIAKELGLHPGELGRAVASLHRQKHEAKMESKMERHQNRRAEKMEKNLLRRQEKSNHGKKD